MMSMLRGSFRDSVVNANPFVSVVIGTHQVVKHVSSFLDQFDHGSGSLGVIRVLFDVLHHEDDFFAHRCTLDSGTTMIEKVDLVLFDSLGNSVLEDFRGGSIF